MAKAMTVLRFVGRGIWLLISLILGFIVLTVSAILAVAGIGGN